MDQNFSAAYDTLDHLPVGVFVLDVEGRYLYTNREYCDTIQKPRSFFEGMSVPKLKELGFLRTSVWEQVVALRKPVISCITVTDEHLNRSYDTLAVGIPRFDSEGNIQSIICRQEEITKLIEYLQQGTLNKHPFVNTSIKTRTADLIDNNFVAESPQMKQITNMLTAVSNTDVSILIVGPSGVGKEVLANRVHKVSARSSAPMITINCAAIPENLLESELFGYVKGAFTGAAKEGKTGMIEAAAGGTLFLDEINSMPLATQTKLLRVLETKQVTRLGAVKGTHVDFRLICASNEDLQTLVNQHKFRGDLFYRINVISVSIPPLKERKEDIIPLALHFMDTFCKKHGRVKALSSSALDQIMQYDWPGNARELRNAIERLVVMSNNSEWEITNLDYLFPSASQSADLETPPHAAGSAPEAEAFVIPDEERFSLKAYMEGCEAELFSRLLRSGRSAAEMARLLKISRSGVFRKLKKYGSISAIPASELP